MAGPFKMKGMSFGNSPMKQKKGPIMPKDHPVIPPTKEESKKSKGTLREIETDLAKARRGLGLTPEQLELEKKKQQKTLRKYEKKYGR